MYRNNTLFFGTVRDYAEYMNTWSDIVGTYVRDISHEKMIDNTIVPSMILSIDSPLNEFTMSTVRDGVTVYQGINPDTDFTGAVDSIRAKIRGK